MASQRKRFFSNDNVTTSHRSNRSASPPDSTMLVSDFHDSCGSLEGIAGMDGSYNGTPSKRLTPDHHSWTATRRSSESGHGRGSTSLLQRHHSGESYTRSPRPNTPSQSFSGSVPRQRPHTVSPFIRKSPQRTHTGDLVLDASASVPYGMLNPGPKGRRLPITFQSLVVRSNSANQKQWIALFGFLTLALLGIAVYQHDAMLQDALQLREQQVDHHILHAKELEKRLQAVRQHSMELEEKLEKVEGEPHVDLETQRKLFHLEHNQLKMQQDVQVMSKRLVKEKFGHGPHYYIQVKLEFDPHSNVYDDTEAGDELVIETASINDMPHSVYLFLEQVDHHLYDHTAFHRNAAHLVQAGPSINPQAHSHFRHNPSLNSVIFQEYAPEMTHKQYTLGYPGRPGGPDFYINMRDNSAINGPGGQHTHYSDIILDADPCFAKIVKGWRAIERVHRSAVEGDVILHPVLIANMKVLPPDYLPTPSDSSDSEDGE